MESPKPSVADWMSRWFREALEGASTMVSGPDLSCSWLEGVELVLVAAWG
jgi:hypothetical protein